MDKNVLLTDPTGRLLLGIVVTIAKDRAITITAKCRLVAMMKASYDS